MKLTVHTIAKDLGVAPSTVSKVLNNTGNFTDETREKILKHIKEVGYVPAMNARVLKSRKSWTIGVIYTEESSVGLEHPYFASVLQHFKDHVEKVGYELSFIVKRLGQHEMSYLSWCKNKKVDGVLIVVGSHNNPGIIELVESDIPCVSTDVFRDKLHTVVSDNEQGVKIALEHAMKLKAKNIAYVSGPNTARSFLYRFQVFRRLMEEKGLGYNEKLGISAKGFGYTSGFQAIQEIIERSDVIPDAVLVGSDNLAFGVIHGLETLGYHVPNDISVIGFDDISFARMFNPSLTTIRQNTLEIGETAARILIDLIDHPQRKETHVTKIPVELVIRNSTK